MRIEDRSRIAPRPLSRRRERGARSPLSAPRSCRGFTLLELIVVIVILVILGGVLIDRVQYYQERAEKTAMEGVVAAIQSSLTMQYGKIMTRGQPSDVEALGTGNPVNLLQKKPVNYAGEFYDPTPQSVPPGSWMFDLKTRELIYVPKSAGYLDSGMDGRKWIRFRVELGYEPSPLPSLQHEPATLSGILFEPTAPYTWF